MAKLVTKFKYLKPYGREGKRNRGGYAQYIATREGVEKIDDSKKHAPATMSQKKLIGQILRDFPDSKQMLEYEDYVGQPTIGNASEFITRVLEDNAVDTMGKKTYADYIATRPRAERFGSHGLFTDEGVEVNLSKVSEDLNKHGGNVWTVIISLRREDAERLGYNNGNRWRDMLRTQTGALAVNLKIPMENLRWFAAFHNESHHPHVHLLAYSVIENEGYLTPKGVSNLRSAFARDIFAQDLLGIYEKQTMHRNELKENSQKIMEKTLEALVQGNSGNLRMEELLLTLNERLSKTSGKKIYGYLKADVKDIVDAITEELAEDKRIQTLYDLWYEQREEVIRTYTQELPKRVPLAENKEFKSIKNMIIREAMHLKTVVRMDEPEEIKDMETMENMEVMRISGDEDFMELSGEKEEAVKWLEKAIEQNNSYAEYLLGKAYLDGTLLQQDTGKAMRFLTMSADHGYSVAQYVMGKILYRGEMTDRDVERAVNYLKGAAKQKNSYAEYQLGKIYLYGTEEERDYEQAIAYLNAAVEHENPYAKQLLSDLRHNRNLYTGLSVFRLLHHMGRILQDHIEEGEVGGNKIRMDRKLKRRIEAKKQAHGLKQG